MAGGSQRGGGIRGGIYFILGSGVWEIQKACVLRAHWDSSFWRSSVISSCEAWLLASGRGTMSVGMPGTEELRVVAGR